VGDFIFGVGGDVFCAWGNAVQKVTVRNKMGKMGGLGKNYGRVSR
jgi:hypothetical protein